jgi:hypothetical protein
MFMELVVHVIQEMLPCNPSVGYAIHEQAIVAPLLHSSSLSPPSLLVHPPRFKPLAIPLETQQAHAQPCQADASLLEHQRAKTDT